MKILSDTETYIYCLLYNDDVKYIGKTDRPNKRYLEHIRKPKYQITYKDNWIYGLLLHSQKPEMLILDIVPKNNFGFWENFYIDLFKSYGFKLTNLVPGGGGGNFGYEINKKISEKLKGRIVSDEVKENIRKGHIGLNHNNDTILKFSEQRCGEKNPMFGVIREKKWDDNRRKCIIQLNLDGVKINEWNSIQDAVNVTKINRTSINSVLKNKRNHAGGYKWIYNDIY